MIPFRVPSFEEVVDFFNSIERVRIRMFAMLQYLTASRPEELCRLRKGKELYSSIRRNDIWIEEGEGGKLLVARIRILKKRGMKKYRMVYLPFSNEREKPLLERVWRWVEKREGELFPFSRITAWRYISKPFKERFRIDIHVKHPIRHVRLTHLHLLYGFDAFDLTEFTGWENIKPAGDYVHKGKELIRKLSSSKEGISI